MAETFEKYTKMRDTGGHLPLEKKIDLAMDQEELIRGVAARVATFLKAYEESVQPELDAAVRLRGPLNSAPSDLMIADTIEQDVQKVAVQGHQGAENSSTLLLDDLKVLLDLLPEGYKP